MRGTQLYLVTFTVAKQLKGVKVWFGSQFRGYDPSWHEGERLVAATLGPWQQELVTWLIPAVLSGTKR